MSIDPLYMSIDPLYLLGRPKDANRRLREKLRARRFRSRLVKTPRPQGPSPINFRLDPSKEGLREAMAQVDPEVPLWLKAYPSDGFRPLVDLLTREPAAIAHPVVVRLLRRVASMVSWHPQPLDWPLPLDSRAFLPHNVLWALTTAWTRGLFFKWIPSGFDVAPTWPRRRGRKPTLDELGIGVLISQFDELKWALAEELRQNPFRYRKRRGEAKGDYVSRLVPLVVDVCRRGFDASTPLPSDAAQKIAARAVANSRLSHRTLLYGILGHFWRRNGQQIRGLIERAQAEDR